MYPVESARSLLVELIRSRVGGGDRLPIDELAEVIRDFQIFGFDVPNPPDADGFLFQYGHASWLTIPTFVVGFTRQLEVVDSGGEHENYSQVAIEYQYPLGESIQAVSSREAWWFEGSDVPFREWLSECFADPIWELIRDVEIAGLSITQDVV
jgi:hypothetical protein